MKRLALRLRLVVSLLTIGTAWIGSLVPSARASSVPTSDFTDLNRLPGRMLDHPTPAEERQFVVLLARYGIDRPGLYTPETRQLFVTKFRALEPYLIRSQANGGQPQESIQELVRSIDATGERERMCAALREWLTLPDDSLHPVTEFYTVPSGSKEAPRRELWGMRCRAAEMLSDWGDVSSLPRMRQWLAGPIDRAPARWSLTESIRRLVSPDSAVFLSVDAAGHLRNHRHAAEVEKAIAGDTSREGRGTAVTLDAPQIQRFWVTLSGAMFARRSEEPLESEGIRIDFQNGIRAQFAVAGPTAVAYTDNTRIEKWSLLLENAALHDLVAEYGALRKSTPGSP